MPVIGHALGRQIGLYGVGPLFGQAFVVVVVAHGIGVTLDGDLTVAAGQDQLCQGVQSAARAVADGGLVEIKGDVAGQGYDGATIGLHRAQFGLQRLDGLKIAGRLAAGTQRRSTACCGLKRRGGVGPHA